MATPVEMTITEKEDIVQNNGNISVSEGKEAAVTDLDAPLESALSGSDSVATETPSNNNEILSTASVGNPTSEERPVTILSLETDENMEVVENLHFENHTADMHNGNSGDPDPLAANACPQVCVTMESECGDKLEDSSSGDSSSDSDSDSSSSSSSSTSSSSSSLLSMIRAGEEEPLENNEAPLKTKDEVLVDELPQVEDMSISLPEDVKIKPFGKVSSMVDQLVIIESLRDIPALNEDTIVFAENRLAVGKIFEIFGPVPHPFYVVRFNSKAHILSIGIKVTDIMYFAPEVEDYTQYIIPDALKRDKGSDASWTNDHEPPTEAIDYSDDEKEKEAKQKKKSQNPGKKKQKAAKDNSSGSQDSKQLYGGQKFSRQYSRNGSASRFSNGRGSCMQAAAFGHQEPYFVSEAPRPHVMQHHYAYHNTNSQDYSMTYANNGHQPPPPHFYEHYQNMQHFPAPPFPPPHMWPEHNMHFSYMQNYPPPPPPPPPPNPPHPNPGNANYSNGHNS